MSEPGYYSGRHGRRRGRRYSLPAMVDRTTDAFRTGFNHSMGGVAIGREAVGGAGMPYGAGAFVQDPRLTGTMYGGGINGAYDGRNVAGSYYGGMPVDQYANGATVVSAQPRAAGVYGAAAPLVIMSPQTTVGGMPMQAGVAPQMVAQGAPLAQPGFSAVMNQYGTAVVPSQSPMAYGTGNGGYSTGYGGYSTGYGGYSTGYGGYNTGYGGNGMGYGGSGAGYGGNGTGYGGNGTGYSSGYGVGAGTYGAGAYTGNGGLQVPQGSTVIIEKSPRRSPRHHRRRPRSMDSYNRNYRYDYD